MWKSKRLFAVLLVVLPLTTKAQLGLLKDFVVDIATGDYADLALSICDYTGDEYWNNVSEDAKKLMEIEIDKSKLSAPDRKYGMTSTDNAYKSIGNSLNGEISKFYEKYSVKPIKSMGNSKIAQHIDQSINKSRNKYANYNILSDETINLLDNQYHDILDDVKRDVVHDPMLGSLINISPRKYLAYYMRTRSTAIRKQKNWMCYLSDLFDTYPDRWPESKKFKYTYDDLQFEQTSNIVSIKDNNNNVLLTIDTRDNTIKYSDLSLLNHKLIPNSKPYYVYGNASCTFYADAIGRIGCISSTLEKGRNKAKTELGKKDLMEPGKKLLYIIPKKYMGPYCIANVYSIPKSKANKESAKALKKQIAKADNPSISAGFRYYGTSNVIEKITIRFNGELYDFEM